MIAVIGDIHGCFYTLQKLINKIESKYKGIEIYSVGDLVDRGNFSLQVVEFIIHNKIKCVLGNHDKMFYYYFNEPDNPLANAWNYNGNDKTLASYQNNQDLISKHLTKFKKFPLFYNLEDCFISHAGISRYYKNYLIENNKIKYEIFNSFFDSTKDEEDGILWNRSQLMKLDKLQIVGHTRQPKITYIENNNSLYIDTSVYTGNKLSSVIINNGEMIDSFSVNTDKKDIT